MEGSDSKLWLLRTRYLVPGENNGIAAKPRSVSWSLSVSRIMLLSLSCSCTVLFQHDRNTQLFHPMTLAYTVSVWGRGVISIWLNKGHGGVI